MTFVALLPICELFSNQFKVYIFFEKFAQLVSIVKLKRHITNVCVFSIIIYNFNHWQWFCLIVLFKVNKNSKIDFYYAILSLILIISLSIKCSKKPLFDVYKIAKRWPILWDEIKAFIGYN